MQVSKNIKYSADVLKQEISKLKNDLGESAKADIQAAETEKQRLSMVKTTIQYLKKAGRISVVKISDSIERLAVRQAEPEKQQKESEKKLGPSLIICMALCALTGILIMGSLIEVNGYDISFLKAAQGLGDWNAYLGSSDVNSMVNFLGFICFLQWVCAGMFFYAVYSLYRKKDSLMVYATVIFVIIIFLVLWIISLSFNSGMEDAMWGYSVIHAKMTGKAWASLVTGCAAAVVFNKRDIIDQNLSGTNQEEQKQEITKTIPVCNYYPWESIRFVNIVLEKDDKTSFYLEYQLPKEMRSRGYRHGWKKDISVKTDIILKVFRKEYIILDNIFNIPWEHASGASQKMILEHMPFGLNEIDNVEVIIKTIEMPGGERKEVPNVYAVSGMNSTDLARYRSENSCSNAVCRKEKADEIWLCTCGYVNDNSRPSCLNCGSRS